MADEHTTSSSCSDSESSSDSRARMLNFVSSWLQNLNDTEYLKLDVDENRKERNEQMQETRILLHAEFHPPTPLSSVARAHTPTSPGNGAAIYFEENSHASDADDEDDTNFNNFVSNRPERRQAKRPHLLMEPDSSSNSEEDPAPSKKVQFIYHRGEPVTFFRAPMEANNCSDCRECCDCRIDAAPLPEEEPPQNHVSNEKLEGPAPSKKVEFADHRGEPVTFLNAPNNCSDCQECCDCPIDAAPLPEAGPESVTYAGVSDFNPSQELTLECTIWDSCCMFP